MDENANSEALLSLWFGPEADDAAAAKSQARLWWSKDEALDRMLSERFGPILENAGTGWPATPRGRLARIILMDQLPRNIHRGSTRMFDWDHQARELARAAIAQGDEAHLRPIERVFLYMPLEHAEDLALQELAVERFEALCALVPESHRPVFADYLDFARRHRDIIRRFGRFPHRNTLLGRASTPEEAAFLKTPGSSF